MAALHMLFGTVISVLLVNVLLALRFLWLIALVVGVEAALATYRWRVGREVTLVFDDKAEPLVRTLNLWA